MSDRSRSSAGAMRSLCASRTCRSCRSRDLPSRCCMDFSADLIDVWDGIKDEGMYEQQSLAARWE